MATTNLGLTLPTVGGSSNTWGDELNTLINALDAIFASTGTSVSMLVDTGASIIINGTLDASGATSVLIDHDALTNFVADEHIAHSGVTLTAGGALTGGGTIAANRTITLDVSALTADATPDMAADYLITYDNSAAGHKKILLNKIDHDTLTNFVADEHIAHAGVTITAGEGLTGGGTIAATRTIDMDVNGLTSETAVDEDADYLVVYDGSAGAHRKVLTKNIPSEVDQFMISRAVEQSVNVTAVSNIAGRIYAPPGSSWTIIAAKAYVDTAGTTGATTIDINKNGTTILSSLLSIASGGTSSTGGALSVTTLVAGDYVTIDVDGISTTPPKGLQVHLQLRATY